MQEHLVPLEYLALLPLARAIVNPKDAETEANSIVSKYTLFQTVFS